MEKTPDKPDAYADSHYKRNIWLNNVKAIVYTFRVITSSGSNYRFQGSSREAMSLNLRSLNKNRSKASSGRSKNHLKTKVA